MINRSTMALSVALLAVAQQAAAGPCSQQIYDTRVAAAARLDAIAGAGRTAVETEGATMHRQPTPNSVARAEEKLGELSGAEIQTFNAAMQRADKADEDGDLSACQQALGEAQRVLDQKP
jgi:hypothetical protein